MKNKVGIIALIVVVVLALAVVAVVMLGNDKTPSDTSSNNENCRTFSGVEEQQCSDDYEGLQRDEAVRLAQDNNLLPKVTTVDGEDQINTDEGGNIILFEVTDGVVTKAYFEDSL